MTPADCSSRPAIVVGIDVGGRRKGFQAVALVDGAYQAQLSTFEAESVVAWSREMGAQFIGVDAPCRWSKTGRSRPAERELMAEQIFCFSTPTLEKANAHPKGHFDWMLNGAKLFAELEKTYPLFTGSPDQISKPICFETFPQAIACALAGEIVSAKQKRTIRRNLLTRAGIDITALSNIDKVDAALCALAAHHLAIGTFKSYGEPVAGLIVVPWSA